MNTENDKNGLSLKKAVLVGIGPLLYIICLMIPELGTLPSRAAFGVTFWLIYCWVSRCIPIDFTFVIPILGATFVPIAPMGKILSAYMDPLILLIVGACAIAAAWIKWGFARRLALRFLVLAGNGTRAQVALWFVLSTVVSMVVADTVVAAAFAPLAIAMLVAVGYETFEQRWNSKIAANIVLAVAWGSALGGFGTPLGGGQALVVYRLLGEAIGKPIDFYAWSIRVIPPTLLIMGAMLLYMRYFLGYEKDRFEGSREIYVDELKKLGPMSKAEWYSAIGFLIGVLLVFLEPLYKAYIPYKLDFGAIFFAISIALFLIPTHVKGENVLSTGTLAKYFPLTAITLWPTAMALAKILEISGALKVVGGWLSPLATASPLTALTGFSAVILGVTQFSTNTAAEAMVIPVLISTMKTAGYNIIPWVLGVGLVGNFSFTIASGCGGLAICAALGANLKRMFVHGIPLAILASVITLLYFYLLAMVLQLDFYLTI